MPVQSRSFDTDAELVLAKAFDRMRFRVLNLIEASVIEGHEEEAVKSLFKSLTYDAQEDVRKAIVNRTSGPATSWPLEPGTTDRR